MSAPLSVGAGLCGWGLPRRSRRTLLVGRAQAHCASPPPHPPTHTPARWWKNVKMWLLIAAVVLVISIVVAMLACGSDFSKCKSS